MFLVSLTLSPSRVNRDLKTGNRQRSRRAYARARALPLEAWSWPLALPGALGPRHVGPELWYSTCIRTS